MEKGKIATYTPLEITACCKFCQNHQDYLEKKREKSARKLEAITVRITKK